MDDPLSTWLLTQLCTLMLYAFFTYLQAIVSHLNEGKLKNLADEGDADAQRLLGLAQSPARAQSALHGARMLFALLFGGLCIRRFAAGAWYAGIALVCALVCAFLLMVLGRGVPKRLGAHASERAAKRMLPLITLISAIAAPFVWARETLSRLLLKLLHADDAHPDEEVTEMEIREMVDIGSESGAIEQNERDMIENIFEFNNSTAEDVMTHRTDVEGVWLEDGDDAILETIKRTGLSRFPVYDEDMDDIVGILNTRDYLLNQSASPKKPLRELLREPYFVPETVRADTLFRNMQKNKIHLAVVVDEYGGMSGICTMEDLLEEIVGNIYDEFDPADEADIVKLSDNTWRVRGTLDLDTLQEELNVTLPQSEDYDTLGGLVFGSLSQIPEDGATPDVTVYCTRDGQKPETGACDTLRIKVDALRDHRVESALVTLERAEQAKVV